MEIWETSLDEFVGRHPVVEHDEEFERACVSVVEEYEGRWSRACLKPIEGREGAWWCTPIGDDESVLLIVVGSKYGDLVLAGGYVDETLWVDSSLRGKGLAAELVIAKASVHGCPLNPVTYTVAGRAAHVAAHRLAVSRAVARGWKVPSKALESWKD